MNDKLNEKVNYLYDSVKAKHIDTKELYHGHFIDLIEEKYFSISLPSILFKHLTYAFVIGLLLISFSGNFL